MMSETPMQENYLSAQKKEIHYVSAKFHRRVFANLTDLIIFALVFLGLFSLIRGIISSTPDFKQKEDKMTVMRLDSGMYGQYTSGKVGDIVSYLDDDINSFSAYAKMDMAKEAVDKFIAYVGTKGVEGASKKVQDDYDTYRLSNKLVYEGVPYFVKQGNEIVRNKDCKAVAYDYFKNAYSPFIDDHCQGYLLTLVPDYLDLVRYESNLLFWAELLPAYVVAPLLVYLLPMFCFKRGRMTLGKAMYRIATVDDRLLVPTWKRTLAKFGLLYGLEILLTPFTFAIPLLVSASLMAFSKKRQTLTEYLLGLHEVDASQQKVYFSREEILLTGAAESKEPVDFKVPYED